MKSGFALKTGTKFYKKGETTELTGDTLTKALKDGEILYTSDIKQDATTLAKMVKIMLMQQSSMMQMVKKFPLKMF